MSKPRPRQLDPIVEARAVQALRESLDAACPADDEDLLRDSIEGETSLFEALDALVLEIAEDQALADGLVSLIDTLKARRERFLNRVKIRRELIGQALDIAGIDFAVERPVATFSLANRKPVLVLTEEAEVPARFWKPGAPSLDRKGLTEALQSRQEALDSLPEDPAARADALAALPPDIPGATLSNAAPTLTIRFR